MKEETIAGNRKMIEFMGGIHIPGKWPVDWLYYDVSEIIETLPIYEPGVTIITAYDLKYHSSWDWLMPVIRKIKDYLNLMERPSKNHCCKGDSLEVDITCALMQIDISRTHAAVIPFITWYNSINPNK